MSLLLYSYWRSSAAYRVRIGLNLKGVDYRQEAINLAPAVSAQRAPTFRQINPQGRVPALATPDGLITQSGAILDWLEEVYPAPSFLPAGRVERARVRMIAQTIAADIHPLNNVSVLGYLSRVFGADNAATNAWYHHWLREGFDAIEALLRDWAVEGFVVGDRPTLAEIYIVPQLANARRFRFDLSPYPRLSAVGAAAEGLPAFVAAAPEAQADAVAS